MTEQDRWNYVLRLDEELLLGGVMLSEWCSFIVCEADTAFAKGANLAAILTAVSGIETHLRAEYGDRKRQTLYDRIETAPIDEQLREDIHRLRRYRNLWVHVDDPNDDEALLHRPEKYAAELEEMARFAVKILRRVIYENQWV